MTEKEPYELVLVNHPAGINNGCAKCREILSSGTWAVGLKIGTHRYAVGKNPARTHCGEEKKEIDVFDTEEPARALLERVREQLNREGTTVNLKLYEFHPSVSDSLH